jgi:hypothetical protein
MEVILVHRAGLVWSAVELTSHSCMWNPSPLSSTHYLHLFFEGPQFFSLYYMFIGEEVDVTVIPSVQTCRAVLWSLYCRQNACELYFWILAASPGPSVCITNAWRMSTEIYIYIFLDAFILEFICLWLQCGVGVFNGLVAQQFAQLGSEWELGIQSQSALFPNCPVSSSCPHSVLC